MVMTDVQLYMAIGLPVFAFLLNIALGVVQTNSLQARISSVETGVNSRLSDFESTMNSRFASVDARFASLELNMNTRFTSLESRFDTLTGKVVEIDNRLTRVEERLLHS
jgi:hypothetical protein